MWGGLSSLNDHYRTQGANKSRIAPVDCMNVLIFESQAKKIDREFATRLGQEAAKDFKYDP